MSPAARRTDPETSHDAAKSVKVTSTVHNAIIRILRKCGPLIDPDLQHEYWSEGGNPIVTASSIRTRRHELVEAGLVRDSGARQKFGRRAHIVWELKEDNDGEL